MIRVMTLAAVAVMAASTASAQNYPWKPEKPITLIVPWAAGGSTDQVSRVAAAEIERVLGQKVVVVNQGGASGSIGTRNVLQAAPDGYTWAAGAAKDLGTYAVSGMLDTKIADWRLYLSVINVSVLSVGNNTAYKTPQDVVAAMKAKPGQVSVGSAGVNSSGHTAIEAFTKALGLTYKHVAYDGGNPAVISTVSGETEVTTQLAVEQAQMIRGKRLRPLAVLSDRPLELEGFGAIAPITAMISGYKPDANYFGILRAQGRAEGSAADPRHDLEGHDRELRGAEEIRDRERRDRGAGLRRRRAQGGDAGDPEHGVGPARGRQVQGRAGHGRHSEAVTPSDKRPPRHERETLHG